MRKRIFLMAMAAAAIGLTGCGAMKKETAPETEFAQATTIASTETAAETADAPTDAGEEDATVETIAAREEMVGGWTEQSPVLTDEVREIFAKAYPDEGENEGDAYYDPIALLGTQVVSGTNYKILFRKGVVGDSTAEEYAVGKIYVDLQGNVEVLSTEETDVKTELNDGAWEVYAVAELTDDEKTAFEGAFDGLLGVSYEPLSVIAEKDTGYMVLCKGTVVYPDAVSYYTVVEIDKTEAGNLELQDISDLSVEQE